MGGIKPYYIPANFRLNAPQEKEGKADWRVVNEDVSQLGTRRNQVVRALSKEYGYLTWRFAWQVGDGKYVPYKEAVKIYEEGYEEHLKANPDKVQYLSETARDVFDNDESNVVSGNNYYNQGKKLTHLQDISIRRVMAKLGHSFNGDKLVRVRKSRNSDAVGKSLSPKLIPFHRPEIVKGFKPIKKQTEPTIEDFWQLNRVIQYSDSLARLKPQERQTFVDDPKKFD